LRRRNRWNRALKKKLTTGITPLVENQTPNNNVETDNVTDSPSTPHTNSNNSNNSDNSNISNNNLQNPDLQDTSPPPSYSPVSSPKSSRSPSPPVRERTAPIPVITLDSDSPSPSVPDHSNSSEIGEALENFARDLSDLDEDSCNSKSSSNSADPSYLHETPEPIDPDPLNYFLSQFPLLDLPLPEGAFCVGPGPVDHEELLHYLTTAPSIIPWYLPGSRFPLGVPIQALWKKFPPSTIQL